MASTSSITRTLSRNIFSPKELLEKANDLVYETSQAGMFVTIFYLFLDKQAGTIKYSSAGHNQQLLLKANGQIHYLHAKGSPLGIIPLDLHGPFGMGEQKVETGDSIVLYTDGVVEAINSKNEEFGMERFIDVLRQNQKKSAQQIIQEIYSSVNDFAGTEPQFDDFTMVLLKMEK